MKVYFSLLLVAFSFWLKAQENYQYKDKVILTNNDTITGEVIDLDIRRMAIVLHKSGRVEKIKDWRINKVIYNIGTTVVIKEEINKLYGGKLDNLLSVESAAFIRNVIKIRFEKFLTPKFSVGLALSTSYSPVNQYRRFRWRMSASVPYYYYADWMKNNFSADVDFFNFYYLRRPHFSAYVGCFTEFNNDTYFISLPYSYSYNHRQYWSFSTGIKNGLMYYHKSGLFAQLNLKIAYQDFYVGGIDFINQVAPYLEFNIGYNLKKFKK
ncbi:MAG TPA: hypothetical protein DIU39_08265 [Flavobacteriales bacterium]|nr:hypothetical protein [Flavobacteriales bacterium]|tara:strand:+ start:88153 stop:88953 length:801 start_codon:yes stop_codon:yes gene_type:complete